jgi:PAS domain S-box-containing protein
VSSDGIAAEKIIGEISQIRRTLGEMRSTWGSGRASIGALDEVDRLARRCLEELSDGCLALDEHLHILSMNAPAERLLHGNAETAVGAEFFEAFPEVRTPFFLEQLRQTVATGTPTSFVALLGSSTAGGWYEWRVFPGEAGLEIYFQAIAPANASAVEPGPDLPEVAREALRACKRSLGTRGGRVVLFREPEGDDEVVFVDRVTVDPLRSQVLSEGGARFDNEIPAGRGTGSARSALCAPLSVDGRLVGFLELSDKPDGFTGEDARVAMSFAARVAVAMGGSSKGGAEFHGISRALASAGGDAVVIFDARGRMIDANPAAARLLGYSRTELLSLDLRGILSSRAALQLPGYMRRLRGTGHATAESENVRRDGTVIPVELDASLVRTARAPAVLCVVRDMRKRKAVEELRTQSRRLEAKGALERGVAHDFNGILTTLLGHAELALSDPLIPPAVAEEIRAVKAEAQRAAAFTLRLLAFTRKRTMQPRLLDINAVVGGMEQRLSRLMDDRAVVRTSLDPSVGTVLADPVLLEQVVIELAITARDAMSGGGALTLVTRRVPAGDAPLALHPEAASTDYAALIFCSTGREIDDAAVQLIHEPFFTSAVQGKEAAMGLATVHGIVQQLGGFIEAEGSASNGASFRVFLPAFPTPASPSTFVLPAMARQLQGAGVVLLVEHDAALRQQEEGVLRRCGYSVIQASGVREALAAIPSGRVVRVAVVPAGDTSFSAELRGRFPEAGLLLVQEEGARQTVPGREPRSQTITRPFSLRELALKVWEMTEQGRD